MTDGQSAIGAQQRADRIAELERKNAAYREALEQIIWQLQNIDGIIFDEQFALGIAKSALEKYK